MTAPSAPVLLWLRRDLRLADNPALRAALASARPVVPVFVLDEDGAGAWAPGGASRWWLHHSLTALAADLAARGAPLVLRRGRFEAEIPRLIAESGAVEVHADIPTEPWARAAYRRVINAIALIKLHCAMTALLHHPDQVRTQAGTPYGMFSPFGRTVRAQVSIPLPEPAPARIPRGPAIASDTVDSWGLLWREFAAHLLWHNPSLPDAPLRAEFAAMPLRDDPAGLRAWQRGQTGIPIVDAGSDRALQAFAALRKAA